VLELLDEARNGDMSSGNECFSHGVWPSRVTSILDWASTPSACR
jgi:hypothetical protein